MPNLTPYYQQFFEALLNQDMGGGTAAIQSALASGALPETVLIQVVHAALDEIGRLQANREVTLSEIYVISKIADQVIAQLLEMLPQKPAASGIVVIGTVAGDYHGLGRKIVASFLRAAGLAVHDLGTSVPAVDFVEKALAVDARVICVSALLLHTAEGVQEIRQILGERGLQEQIKLIVGGAAFNFDPQLYKSVGADGTALNATDAVHVVRQAMEEG